MPSLRKHKSSSQLVDDDDDDDDDVESTELRSLDMPVLRSCISSGTLSSPEKLSRQVSFTKVEIREYDRTIGDNVASCGVPISLDWNSTKVGELDLDAYEEHKFHPPRTQAEMKLPSHVRMEIARHAGFSLRESIEAAKASNLERDRRRASQAKTMELDRAEYVLEKAGRTFYKLRRRVSGSTGAAFNGSKAEDEIDIETLIRLDRRRVRHMKQLRKTNSDPALLMDDEDDDEVSALEAMKRNSDTNLFLPKFGKPTKRGSLLFDDDDDE